MIELGALLFSFGTLFPWGYSLIFGAGLLAAVLPPTLGSLQGPALIGAVMLPWQGIFLWQSGPLVGCPVF